MELIFRQRLDRPDKLGRAAIFGDLHWAGGHRWKMPTGVKVLPAHWQPTKTKRIHTSAENSAQLNLRLTRLLTAVQGVFTTAEGQGKPEASVTQAELEAALAAVGAGSQRRAKQVQAEAIAAADAPMKDTAPWAEFEVRWRAENEHLLADSYLRMYRQVVSSLTEFDPKLRLATLTRERLAQYVAWLFADGKRESTVQRHYIFLRECQRMAGRVVPKWLGKFTVRQGRSPALRRVEVLALAAATDLPTDLLAERDAFLLQLLLLLRDVDLRALKPHHVSAHDLPGHGPTLCVELYQQKTSEPVLVPLPPAAAAIWQRYGGQLNLPTQQERNRRLKVLGQAVGLEREFVEVIFAGKNRSEQVHPMWQVLTTHTARHSGAGLLVLGSEGDQTLKEIALGHVSASVYGYDTLERYGPRLLDAWAAALGSLAVAEPAQLTSA
ncbi:phage integrase SAM-like domain-containing protein [Hymenobacter bucti]|uniref:Phage integrase SAM-like domain-containing protein n=1 Tax=Hymenobacter bucti TaxID=1844114 RepID=A0ABW4QWU3_9BACT